MTAKFKAFADDTAALTIAGLTVENGLNRVNLSGTLEFARDRKSLEHARALRLALDDIIAALEAEELPAKAAPPVKARTTKAANPFA